MSTPATTLRRDQSLAFGQEVEDVDGIGDEAFIATFPQDEGVTLDELIEAVKTLGRLVIEANR